MTSERWVSELWLTVVCSSPPIPHADVVAPPGSALLRIPARRASASGALVLVGNAKPAINDGSSSGREWGSRRCCWLAAAMSLRWRARRSGVDLPIPAVSPPRDSRTSLSE